MARFSDLSKYEWRKVGTGKDRTVQRRVTERLDNYGTVGSPLELIAKVDRLGLEDARLEVEVKNDYYDDHHAELLIKGWREAGEVELAEALAKVDAAKEEERQWKLRQIEELRRSDPDLFKQSSE